MTAIHPSGRPAAIAALALLAGAYAFGLGGPFVLDDHVNLAPVWQWLDGQRSAHDAAFGSKSGPLGRPLAYATFMANAALGGQASFGFKLVNLLLHGLAATLLVGVLLRVLALAAPQARPRTLTLLAIGIAALWALHPLHVSTVLYVVQRMTLLAALAQLGAVLAYLDGRALLARDPQRARWLLFLVFPGLIGIGLLAKETAVMALAYVAVLELALFRAPRPRALRAFFLFFLLLPVAAGALYLLLDPSRIVQGYERRTFSLAERLLTQPRVLGDYLLALLLPLPGKLALFRDGYPLSTGWLQPLATAGWLLAWGVLAALAWALRTRLPLLLLGVSWFVAGHALESSFIPLEIHFEHRNYLPSVGILLAVFALLRAALPAPLSTLAMAGAVVLALVLAGSTAYRAYGWSSTDRLFASEAPPQGEVSPRLQVSRAIRAHELEAHAARQEILAALHAARGGASIAAVWDALLACDASGGIDARQREALLASRPPVLTHNHVSYLGLLIRHHRAARCSGLADADLLAVLRNWQAAPEKPVSAQARRRLGAMVEQLTP
jgi:protein O-mannosyl-transferase